MATKETQKIRDSLEKLSKKDAPTAPPPVVQEIAKAEEAPRKTGRKKHLLEGVEYARIGATLPVDLKTEMEIAIRTTHKDFPTIDTFVAEAVRLLLAKKK